MRKRFTVALPLLPARSRHETDTRCMPALTVRPSSTTACRWSTPRSSAVFSSPWPRCSWPDTGLARYRHPTLRPSPAGLALGTGWQRQIRLHAELVTAVRAAIRAGPNVTPNGGSVCHRDSPSRRFRTSFGGGPPSETGPDRHRRGPPRKLLRYRSHSKYPRPRVGRPHLPTAAAARLERDRRGISSRRHDWEAGQNWRPGSADRRRP